MGLFKRIKTWLFRRTLDYKIIHAGEKPKDLPPLKSEYPAEWLDLALKITGKFEGKGFGQVTGNGDGQGMSCGILQWCYGQGSLQDRILKPYIELYGANALNGYFPINVAQTAYLGPDNAIRWAKEYMLDRSGNVKPNFKLSWQNFLLSPQCIAIQKVAADHVARKALKYCIDWNFRSKKAFCFMFDLITQNGSMKFDPKVFSEESFLRALDEAPARNRDLWATLPVDSEMMQLMCIAHKRAGLSNPKYADLTYNRRGSIAMELGYVYGSLFDFREDFKND
jgi:hypothetical protein